MVTKFCAKLGSKLIDRLRDHPLDLGEKPIAIFADRPAHDLDQKRAFAFECPANDGRPIDLHRIKPSRLAFGLRRWRRGPPVHELVAARLSRQAVAADVQGFI
jgi:hypothetical protein